MACPNCSQFHHLCKAGCCGVFPMDKALLEAHRDKIQIPITEEMDMGDEQVIAMTKNAQCAFLKSDYSCAIYDHRPEVCKLFGNEEHLNLTCSFQTKDGIARSYFSRSRIQKDQTKRVNKLIKQNK